MVKPINVFKKICVLGDTKVGKTSIVNMFVAGEFSEDYVPSIGTKVSKKVMPIADPSGRTQGLSVNLMIWDILGSREHSHLHRAYYAGAEGAIVVCDATREDTIEQLGFWVENFRPAVRKGSPVFVALNKMDLVDDSRKDENIGRIRRLCRELNVAYVEVSAKAGENIENLFYTISENIIEAQPF